MPVMETLIGVNAINHFGAISHTERKINNPRILIQVFYGGIIQFKKILTSVCFQMPVCQWPPYRQYCSRLSRPHADYLRLRPQRFPSPPLCLTDGCDAEYVSLSFTSTSYGNLPFAKGYHQKSYYHHYCWRNCRDATFCNGQRRCVEDDRRHR